MVANRSLPTNETKAMSVRGETKTTPRWILEDFGARLNQGLSLSLSLNLRFRKLTRTGVSDKGSRDRGNGVVKRERGSTRLKFKKVKRWLAGDYTYSREYDIVMNSRYPWRSGGLHVYPANYSAWGTLQWRPGGLRGGLGKRVCLSCGVNRFCDCLILVWPLWMRILHWCPWACSYSF